MFFALMVSLPAPLRRVPLGVIAGSIASCSVWCHCLHQCVVFRVVSLPAPLHRVPCGVIAGTILSCSVRADGSRLNGGERWLDLAVRGGGDQ